jgi:hypothetical protein
MNHGTQKCASLQVAHFVDNDAGEQLLKMNTVFEEYKNKNKISIEPPVLHQSSK